MNKRYKITIEEEAEETTLTSKDWEKDDSCERGYNYTPQEEQVEMVKRVIYTQSADEIDLVEVIKALNGIK